MTRIFEGKKVYCFQQNYDFYHLLLIIIGIPFFLFCWFDDAIALYCFGKVYLLLLGGVSDLYLLSKFPAIGSNCEANIGLFLFPPKDLHVLPRLSFFICLFCFDPN